MMYCFLSFVFSSASPAFFAGCYRFLTLGINDRVAWTLLASDICSRPFCKILLYLIPQPADPGTAIKLCTVEYGGKTYTAEYTITVSQDKETTTKKENTTKKPSKLKLNVSFKQLYVKDKYQIKVISGKAVRWESTNKKVVTVSKKGKVVAKKKGTAIVKVKVGNRVLRCKVTVKDKRKAVSNKPNSNTDENNSNTDNSNTTCQHTWVKHYVEEEVTVMGCQCACGKVFENSEDWHEHRMTAATNKEPGHAGYSDIEITTTVTKTKYICSKCGAEKE